MAIDMNTVTVLVESDTVRWRETERVDVDDYPELLRTVDRLVRRRATTEQLAAWITACERGNGPDADRNADGWRVIPLEAEPHEPRY